jgi:hypothetical protein
MLTGSNIPCNRCAEMKKLENLMKLDAHLFAADFDQGDLSLQLDFLQSLTKLVFGLMPAEAQVHVEQVSLRSFVMFCWSGKQKHQHTAPCDLLDIRDILYGEI